MGIFKNIYALIIFVFTLVSFDLVFVPVVAQSPPQKNDVDKKTRSQLFMASQMYDTGKLERERGNSKIAIEFLEMAVKISPKWAEARIELAKAYAMTGNRLETYKHLDVYRELANPDKDQTKSNIYDTLTLLDKPNYGSIRVLKLQKREIKPLRLPKSKAYYKNLNGSIAIAEGLPDDEVKSLPNGIDKTNNEQEPFRNHTSPSTGDVAGSGPMKPGPIIRLWSDWRNAEIRFEKAKLNISLGIFHDISSGSAISTPSQNTKYSEIFSMASSDIHYMAQIKNSNWLGRIGSSFYLYKVKTEKPIQVTINPQSADTTMNVTPTDVLTIPFYWGIGYGTPKFHLFLDLGTAFTASLDLNEPATYGAESMNHVPVDSWDKYASISMGSYVDIKKWLTLSAEVRYSGSHIYRVNNGSSSSPSVAGTTNLTSLQGFIGFIFDIPPWFASKPKNQVIQKREPKKSGITRTVYKRDSSPNSSDDKTALGETKSIYKKGDTKNSGIIYKAYKKIDVLPK